MFILFALALAIVFAVKNMFAAMTLCIVVAFILLALAKIGD